MGVVLYYQSFLSLKFGFRGWQVCNKSCMQWSREHRSYEVRPLRIFLRWDLLWLVTQKFCRDIHPL